MGTFSRLRYVIAANANALIEKAEDPEKLLRALIREMEDAGEEARLASAELLAQEFGVAADIWSATSFNQLRRDGIETQRWNMLHPEAEPRLSHIESTNGRALPTWMRW